MLTTSTTAASSQPKQHDAMRNYAPSKARGERVCDDYGYTVEQKEILIRRRLLIFPATTGVPRTMIKDFLSIFI